MKDRQTERIEQVLELLNSWECLEHLSVRERYRIESEMVLLVENSIEDFKRAVMRLK
jgi:hypothetical protein